MSGLIVPGQLITADAGYLRGHGSYISTQINDQNNAQENAQALISSVAGVIVRVNKLISVKPLKSRYIGEVGDLIVGRISSVDSKRWKVNICGQKDAMLQLSSINLPGGVQRMKTYEDQLQMRSLFVENDLISAEIQNINSEGVVSLHSRSLKYGKLENGQLIVVPAVLIKRLPQHYVSLPFGVDVVLGVNGFIWITRSIPEDWKAQEADSDDITPLAESLQNLKQRHCRTPLLMDERLKVARVHNAVNALSEMFISISPESIMVCYQRSIDLGIVVKDMIQMDNILRITDNLT